jgi:hypothetical protein
LGTLQRQLQGTLYNCLGNCAATLRTVDAAACAFAAIAAAAASVFLFLFFFIYIYNNNNNNIYV